MSKYFTVKGQREREIKWSWRSEALHLTIEGGGENNFFRL
jgi:hypothetical protein